MAKWQRLESYVPGVYAVKVVGVVRRILCRALSDAGGIKELLTCNQLPEDTVQVVEDAGVKYIP